LNSFEVKHPYPHSDKPDEHFLCHLLSEGLSGLLGQLSEQSSKSGVKNLLFSSQFHGN
jgi:hypothetical protein